ncbi:MAG TPA: hypothetical protein VIT45_02415 [Allosphingosinicella sp.]
MRTAHTLLVAALALAACEDGAPEQNIISVRAANPTSDNIKTLQPRYRHLSLWRGIRYNRGACKKVDRGHYQQEYKNMAMWTAHCIDSGDWAVFIAPDASVQAAKCSDAESLRLPACKPIPEEPAEAEPAPARTEKAPAR